MSGASSRESASNTYALDYTTKKRGSIRPWLDFKDIHPTVHTLVCMHCVLHPAPMLPSFHLQLKASLQRSAHTSSSASPSPTSSSSASAASAFSCRISPWLALGCLSPRHMYHILSSKLGAQGSADLRSAMAPTPAARAVPGAAAGPASWLMFELLWRDFFRSVQECVFSV